MNNGIVPNNVANRLMSNNVPHNAAIPGTTNSMQALAQHQYRQKFQNGRPYFGGLNRQNVFKIMEKMDTFQVHQQRLPQFPPQWGQPDQWWKPVQQIQQHQQPVPKKKRPAAKPVQKHSLNIKGCSTADVIKSAILSIDDLRSAITKNNEVISKNHRLVVDGIEELRACALDTHMRDKLTPDQLKDMKRAVNNLCSAQIIESVGGGNYSIDELDFYNQCFEVIIKAEEAVIAFDAIINGYDDIEIVKKIGSGHSNGVFEGKLRSGKTVVIKPCDAVKVENDREKFHKDIRLTWYVTGVRTGAMRRNNATVGIQNIMMKLGAPKVFVGCSAGLTKDGMSCIVMDFVPGEQTSNVVQDGRMNFQDPHVRHKYIEGETWMQIGDVLSGQVDRHSGNVMLNGGHMPIGIDHKSSFSTVFRRPGIMTQLPTKLTDSGKEPWSDPEVAFDTFCVPPVIDVKMFNAINNLNLTELIEMYEEHGLTSMEIIPAMERAKLLKKAALQMRDNGMVISGPSPIWATSKLAEEHCDVDNFYALRHAKGRFCQKPVQQPIKWVTQ
ncbi:MAG: hypothetical protein LBR91_00690 [Puniceicoccales bacterium]|jgi:hypothetical protein|nr:hypothetical protein [Puniceicoccales bacterium]